MAKYTIKLAKEEASALMAIADKGSHTSQAYRGAHALLSCGGGEFRLGKSTHGQIAKVPKSVCEQSIVPSKSAVEGGAEKVLQREKGSRIYGKKN
jgi:hypothetical protein